MYVFLGSSSETASTTITVSLAASSASAKWNVLVIHFINFSPMPFLLFFCSSPPPTLFLFCSSPPFLLQVRQIDCGTSYAAPEGCTMYLTGANGAWSTYGYTGTTTTEHPQTQSYQVCWPIQPSLLLPSISSGVRPKGGRLLLHPAHYCHLQLLLPVREGECSCHHGCPRCY